MPVWAILLTVGLMTVGISGLAGLVIAAYKAWDMLFTNEQECEGPWDAQK